MRSFLTLSLLGSALVVTAACSSGTGETGAGGGGGMGGDNGTCTAPTAVACSDQIFQGMNYQTNVASGLIVNDPDGAGFISKVDATAGGFGAPNPDSYVYAKFSATGLEKVAISDEQSLDSMDWDIAFRRFIIRLNSGSGGPSCVSAARFAENPTYEATTAPPPNALYKKDDFFSDSCEMIPDGKGLPGSPATVLGGYWSYVNCVKMTDLVYVIRLADGRLVKFIVDSYYKPEVQEQCDTTDMIPMMDTGSAVFQVRWAFLP